MITNLGVFLFQNMYAKNLAGLIECYEMAIPFFRNTFLSDILFSFVLFSVYAFVKSYSKKIVPSRHA